MYCVMHASVPSLHNVYRRYDSTLTLYPSIAPLEFRGSSHSILAQVKPTSATVRPSGGLKTEWGCKREGGE